MPRLIGVGLAVAMCAATTADALGICVEGTYPPFSEIRADGTIIGFDIDIANALCAEIGEACEMVPTTWGRMIPSLLAGRCDAIIASMSDTAERRNQIDFSARYYKAPVRFVGPAEADLSDADGALDTKTVGVQRGTINETYMAAHYPLTKLRVYETQEHVLLDLTLGRIDAVLGEAPQLDAGFLKTPAGVGYRFFGANHFDPAIQGEGAAIGVRKADTALRDRFSTAIASLRADGRYTSIEDKYFDIDIYGAN